MSLTLLKPIFEVANGFTTSLSKIVIPLSTPRHSKSYLGLCQKLWNVVFLTEEILDLHFSDADSFSHLAMEAFGQLECRLVFVEECFGWEYSEGFWVVQCRIGIQQLDLEFWFDVVDFELEILY